jgi:hypothetical protein
MILAGNPDYVVDCIGNNVIAKIDLIQACKRQRINIVSAGSAAGKIDPTRLEVADISKTKNCEAVRLLRKTLKKRGIIDDVQVIYYAESSRTLPGTNISAPAIGTLTSILGNSVCSFVLSKLGGVPFEPFIKTNYKRPSFLRLCRHLEHMEKTNFKVELEMDLEEIEHVARGV